MDLNSFFLLFPSIFMLHEFEEMLLFPYFMGRNQLRHLYHCYHSVYIPCDWTYNSKYFTATVYTGRS